MATRKSQAVKTAERKAQAFLKRTRADVRDRKAQDRLKIVAERAYISAEHSARLALASKAEKVLLRVGKALREGRLNANDLDRQRLRQILGEGLEDWRADLHIGNNARVAFHAGRYEQQKGDRKIKYLHYLTRGDERVRANHRKLHNLVMPKDWKGWPERYPPNGHGCRCEIKGMTQAQYDEAIASDKTLKTKPPREKMVTYIDQVTGEKVRVPESVDPGWGQAPDDSAERMGKLLERSIQRLEKMQLKAKDV